MRSFTLKENHIGSAVGEILRHRQTSCYFIISLLRECKDYILKNELSYDIHQFFTTLFITFILMKINYDTSTHPLAIREGGEIGLFITLVPKVL